VRRGVQTGCWLVVLASLVVFGSDLGCSQETVRETDQADFSVPDVPGSDLIVGEVAGKPIPAGFLLHKMRIQFPDMPQSGPAMVRQAREILKRVLMEESLIRFAEERGYDKDDEFLRALYLSRSYILSNQAAESGIYSRVNPTDEELREAYNADLERFRISPQIWWHHILVDSEAAAVSVRQRLHNGEDFEALAKELSLDTSSGRNGGKMNPMGTTYIAGKLGAVPDLGEELFRMKEGDVSDPIQTEHGWHIVRVDAVRRERQRTFEEVRDDIYWQMIARRRTSLYNEVTDSLMIAYEAQVFDDMLDRWYLYQLDDEELFTEAQADTDPQKQILCYEMLRERYPESERAPEALFMIGFLCAEDADEPERARKVFEEFLSAYPDHSLAPSARNMLDELMGNGGS